MRSAHDGRKRPYFVVPARRHDCKYSISRTYHLRVPCANRTIFPERPVQKSSGHFVLDILSRAMFTCPDSGLLLRCPLPATIEVKAPDSCVFLFGRLATALGRRSFRGILSILWHQLARLSRIDPSTVAA